MFTRANAAECGRRGGQATWRNLAQQRVPHPRGIPVLIPADRAQRLKAAATMRLNGQYRRMGIRSGEVRRRKRDAE